MPFRSRGSWGGASFYLGRKLTQPVNLEIQDMRKKENNSHCFPAQGNEGFFCSVFLVPNKAGGNQQPVVNLRLLDQFLPNKHFKMEGIHIGKGATKERRFYGQDQSQGYIFHVFPLSRRL